MQKVIAEYFSQSAAEQAVRSLEQHQISIQDVVIVDRRNHIWRSLRPLHGRRFAETSNFVVLMRGERENIDRARELLS